VSRTARRKADREAEGKEVLLESKLRGWAARTPARGSMLGEGGGRGVGVAPEVKRVTGGPPRGRRG